MRRFGAHEASVVRAVLLSNTHTHTPHHTHTHTQTHIVFYPSPSIFRPPPSLSLSMAGNILGSTGLIAFQFNSCSRSACRFIRADCDCPDVRDVNMSNTYSLYVYTPQPFQPFQPFQPLEGAGLANCRPCLPNGRAVRRLARPRQSHARGDGDNGADAVVLGRARAIYRKDEVVLDKINQGV